MDMFVGIEIGGTKLQFGVGPGDGTLAEFQRLPVNVASGAEGIRQQILETVPRLIDSARSRGQEVKGICFGFGGPVDDATRCVLKSHQVEGWSDFPLAEWTENHFKLPAILGNDCDVAGLAEALFGAGQGLSPIFYITIGSGIGGGLIIDGEIYRGSGKGAAEVGHLNVYCSPDSEEAASGLVTDLESVASGWAIANRVRQLRPNGLDPESPLYRLVLGQRKHVTAKHVGQAAAAGDRLAQDIIHETCHYLAQAIAAVVALVCPRRIVIGGGVSLMGNVLFEPLRWITTEVVFKSFADCYDIVPAALGEEVVVHGALALARKRLG